MGNCLMMHVVYFRRTRYGIPSLGSNHGDQGSTDYQVIQFSVIRAFPDYGATPVTLLCGVVVFSYLGLVVRPGSAPGVLDHGTRHAQYPSKTHTLHWQAITITIIFV